MDKENRKEIKIEVTHVPRYKTFTAKVITTMWY